MSGEFLYKKSRYPGLGPTAEGKIITLRKNERGRTPKESKLRDRELANKENHLSLAYAQPLQHAWDQNCMVNTMIAVTLSNLIYFFVQADNRAHQIAVHLGAETNHHPRPTGAFRARKKIYHIRTNPTSVS